MFKKKQKVHTKFTLSNDAIIFIRDYALQELDINGAIDEDTLSDIIELAAQWELDMIDTTTKDYGDKSYDYPEKQRNELADKFVSEISGQWDDYRSPDLDDLNTRLGLKS